MTNDFTRAGEAFAQLVEIIARLRAPDGCPWDREQTHHTLRTHLLEEAFEVVHAIEEQDATALCGELGDLLMQPVLHAQIASESGTFDMVAVLEAINQKLIRRHPHVFGEVTVSDSGEVLRNWEAIKQHEKAERKLESKHVSVLDDIPSSLPALLWALKVSKKAARCGFEWPDLNGVLAKLREEVDELEAELEHAERAAEELGDIFFTLVNVGRHLGINSELAVRDMVQRFILRFQDMEQQCAMLGRPLTDLSAGEWDALWEDAKRRTSAPTDRPLQ